MGCGASRNRARRDDPIVPLPALHPLRRRLSPAPFERTPRARSVTPPPTQRRPRGGRETDSPPARDEEWPLPPKGGNATFETKWFTDKERYSLIRAYNKKLPASTLVMIKATVNRERHQKEMSTTQWHKDNSAIYDSAHVQSSLKTQSHACYNLSTTEEMDTLMAKLNHAHVKLDDVFKRRLDIVSKETEDIIERIAVDTQDIQQRLLAFSKVRQTRQDELYREWLQMYVVKLDEWKSLQLTQLQEELSTYQKQIIIQSQSLISSINREANLLKAQILREEQEGASQEVNEIIAQIESLSSQQTLQHLGSETMTKMNLTVQANVGRKAPGQHCKFDFGDNVEVPAPPVKRPPSKTNNANRRGDNGKQEEQ